ncbi:MAG TPA: hypothetical protein VF535_11555 [Allosphingosinicella sp.]|jgi:hypothetical protein
MMTDKAFGASAAARLLLAVGGAALVAGCSTLQNQSRVDPRTVANYPRDDRIEGDANCPMEIGGDTHGGAINLDCFRFPDQKPKGKTAYDLAVDGQVERNRLAAILIKHADDVCTQELGRLTANEAITNTALATVASTLSGIATIVTGAHAKEIFAAGSGLATASRSHVNAHVFRNVLSTAVSRAIHIERDKQRAAIQAQLAKDSAAYNVDQMVVEVNAYHQTCSFYRGLTLVLEAVDRTKFEDSDRAGGLRAGIQELENQIQKREAQKARAAAVADQEAIQKQIDELRAEQTKRILELAALRVETPGGGEVPQQ